MTIKPIARIVVLFALILGAVAAEGRAHACLCLPPPPPLEKLARSAAVLEGKITALSRDAEFLYADVSVMRRWKSPDVARVVVATSAGGGAACGYVFEVGQTWLFYTLDNCGLLVTGLCNQSLRIEDATDDLKALGAPLAPGSTLIDGGVAGDGGLPDAGVCRDAGPPAYDFAPAPDLASRPDLAAAIDRDLAAPQPDLAKAAPLVDTGGSCTIGSGRSAGGGFAWLVLVGLALLRGRRKVTRG